MRRIAFLCFMLIGLWAGTATAQVSVGEKGTLKGTVFGDFYWIPQNHDSELEGNNGFWFRRIYVTYERDISDSFSSRMRLEMSSEGDFVTDSKLNAVIKDAYLKWSNQSHSIYAGITSVPTWGLVEDVWGYRSVEKTPLDLQKFGSSRDFGIKARGKLGPDKKLGYNLMVGNGNSNATELNKGKKAMLALNYRLTDNWTVEAYGDYNGLTGENDIYTAQGFLAYQSETLHFGALYAVQFRENTTLAVGNAVETVHLDLASLFTNFKITEQTRGLFRIDHMLAPNPQGPGIDYIPFSEEAQSTLFLGGVDIELDPMVHLIPNIETVVYGENSSGETPGADVIPRLTLHFNF